MNKKTHLIAAGLLLLLGFSARLLPHPANFAPITAIALFGAIYLPKKWAIVLPLAAVFLSDIFIGFYSWKSMMAVYGSFVLAGLIGFWIRKQKKFARVVGGTLLASIVFFLITNAAVWAFGTMYTKDLSGLISSYYMALPFFRNSLLSDFFYVTILIGGMELLLYWQAKKASLQFIRKTHHF